MKRSDVIESIVYNCLSWDGLDTSGVPKEEIANDILTHLEKLGMLLCEKRDLGSMGKLWTPKGFDPEEDYDPKRITNPKSIQRRPRR